MDEQTGLQNFSLEGDQVALPKGAWAQSHRLNVRWRGRDLTALSQGAFRAYLFPGVYAGGLCGDERVAAGPSAP